MSSWSGGRIVGAVCPLKGEHAGQLASTRFPAAGGRPGVAGIELLAGRFSARGASGRRDRRHGASWPAQSPAHGGSDSRSHSRDPERSAARPDRSRPMHGSSQAPAGAGYQQGATSQRTSSSKP